MNLYTAGSVLIISTTLLVVLVAGTISAIRRSPRREVPGASHPYRKA
jgi:hypothetical protein